MCFFSLMIWVHGVHARRITSAQYRWPGVLPSASRFVSPA